MAVKKKGKVILPFVMAAALAAAALLAACVGVISIPLGSVAGSILHKMGFNFSIAEYHEITLWQLRLPRIVMSVVGGASLAVCGGVFQSVFRNPVCDPYILGVSSGASIGAAVAFVLGWDAFLFGITLPALTAALLTLLLIYGIAEFRGRHSTTTILLVGIAINFFISAIITLIMVVNQQEMHKIFFWTMGSLSNVSWSEVAFLTPVALICTAILIYNSKALNIIQAGEETAMMSGVDTRKTTMAVLAVSSVLTAVVVAFCGSIGFIGLIVPHIVRIVFGSDNRRVFGYSLFFGAAFLLAADTLARTVAMPSELPVGSITAIAGSPYFIYLVLKKK